MDAVSQSYQGLRPSFPPPSYQKHVFPDPSPHMIQEISRFMPHFRETYEYSELGAMYAQANKDVVRNDCRIERDKIEALCTKMRQGSPDISTQDCLTAYIVTVLNRCIQPPILNITNAASVMFAFESPTPVLI